MTIELIPVLESGYSHPDVPVPDKHPYWEHSVAWDKYRQETYSGSGFRDRLKPYFPGSMFYKPADFSKERLVVLIKNHTEDFRNGKYHREQASALFGGFVLCVNGQDMFYPQCCGTLGDINYWEELADGKENVYYEGHPAPAIDFSGDMISFDFTGDEDESFQPPPPRSILQIDRNALKVAVEKAKGELMAFSEVLEWINNEEHLDIERIDDLLIWGG